MACARRKHTVHDWVTREGYVRYDTQPGPLWGDDMRAETWRIRIRQSCGEIGRDILGREKCRGLEVWTNFVFGPFRVCFLLTPCPLIPVLGTSLAPKCWATRRMKNKSRSSETAGYDRWPGAAARLRFYRLKRTMFESPLHHYYGVITASNLTSASLFLHVQNRFNS